MKVVLVNPPASNGLRCIREGRCEQRAESFQYLMTPISLPSIASVLLKDEFEVKIIDCIAANISFEDLELMLRKLKPQLVIVNVATVSFNTDKLVADICQRSKIPVAAYGVHVTTTPDETLKNTNFDFLIRAEPELIVLELAKAVREKRDIHKVLGISFKKDGKIFHNNPATQPMNLDALPFPNRFLLDNEKYIAPISHEPYTLIISSRGCPFNCIYCTAHKYYGKNVRFRSAENIVAEMRHVTEKLGIRFIAMWSDTFTLKKDFVLDLCNKIIESKLDVEWYCNSRVDTVDEDMIEAMAKAHCKVITLGVESLDQKMLNRMRKGIKVQRIKDTINLCRKHGIITQAHLIFGLPGENKDTIRTTIKGIIDANPDYAEFYCAVPFPGTDFNEFARKNNLLTTHDYARYELNQAVVSYPHLSDIEIKNAMIRAYRAFYIRPSYVLRKVKEFPITQWPSIARQAFSWAKDWIFG